MRRHVLLPTMFALACCGGCKTLQGVAWPAVVTCVAQPAADLSEEVASVLSASTGKLTDEEKGKLADLGAKRGLEAVLCAVQAIAQGVAQQTGVGMRAMSTSQEENPAARRAQEFLASIGATVTLK